MIRLVFVWLFQFLIIAVVIRIFSWAMKKSWFFKSCVYGYDVRASGKEA